MSYDLYFKSAAPIPVAALKRHFKSRPNSDVSADLVDYDNPDSGVHFQWWYGEPEPGENADDPLSGAQATLSVNFNRPTPFIHEAAREASAFSKAFDMQMIDPQTDGKAHPYDAGLFTAGYIASAQRVTRGLLEHAKADRPPTLPRQDLNRIWSWNDQRNDKEVQLSDDLFVPKIMLLRRAGRIETAVTWGDGVPMCCPRVDTILCLRHETAPTTGFFRKKRQDLIEAIRFDDFLAEFGDLFKPSDRFTDSWSCHSSDRRVLMERLTGRDTSRAQPMDVWKSREGAGVLPFYAVIDAEFFD